jgi:hypothetical protein
LADWGWPVLVGRPLRSRTEMRVMADAAPKKFTLSSGGKVPYILRREFPPASSSGYTPPPSSTPPTASATGATGTGANASDKMEEDECQNRIDAQMQGFLNADSKPSSQPASSQDGARAHEERPCPNAVVDAYKQDMNVLKQEVMQMMKLMEERQDRAEQRQDVAEKRIEGAIAEIVAEQKSSTANTNKDIGDLKSMMSMMVQQQTAMMQMLQGDDRRVKPKTDGQPTQ